MEKEKSMPLWKQLLGAATGATVALALYGAFIVASPRVQALLPSVFEGKVSVPKFSTKRTVYEGTVAKQQEHAEQTRIASALFRGETQESSSSAVIANVLVPSADQSFSISSAYQASSSAASRHSRGTRTITQEHDSQKLPDSGVPVWGGAGAALLASAYIRRRKKNSSKKVDDGIVDA